ncbi:hypothetical protein [Desulfovibrio cuneatus]|uniref:hypothetical protein n=1 Tax=Desulfovibrio cuneatus TaxID=159728 RepID=UPI00041AFF44|nr:hypothetical protein [Desulfovibrio cuneatus]
MKQQAQKSSFSPTVAALLVAILVIGGGIYVSVTGQPAWLAGIFSSSKPSPSSALNPAAQQPTASSQGTGTAPLGATPPGTANTLQQNNSAAQPLAGQSTTGQPENTQNATSHAEGAGHELANQPNTEDPQTEGLLEYSQAKPVRGKEVRGIAVPLNAALPAEESSPKGQDRIITQAFFQAVAQYLVNNYWPQGSHPNAMYSGISTFSVRSANSYFGVQLPGLGVQRENPSQGRAQLFAYAFMPSMLREIYTSNRAAFMQVLRSTAANTEKNSLRLTKSQQAEMFGIYASKFRGIAGAIAGYARTPNMPQLLAHVENTWQTAMQANASYREGSTQDLPTRTLSALANTYLEASVRGEQARADVASAMRMRGETRGLEADELVAIAKWLARRGEHNIPAVEESAAIILNVATHLEEAERTLATAALEQSTHSAPPQEFPLQKEEAALSDEEAPAASPAPAAPPSAAQ